MHRIFVAIPISSELQKTILDWRENYQQSSHQLHHQSPHQLPIRWLPGKNLHITLIPPWYENDPPSIIAKFQSIKNKISPLNIRFTKITYGPNPTRPSLIWVSGKAPQALLDLQKELQKILQENGLKIPPENRPFLLHLTLARFREENFHNFPIKILNENISWPENISAIVLMRSHLSQSGADYEILEKIEFNQQV